MSRDLAYRVARLERANRIYRLGFLALAVVLLGVGLPWRAAPAGGVDRALPRADNEAPEQPGVGGRTLDDTRRTYAPPAEMHARAAVEPAPPPAPAPLRIVEAEVFAMLDREGRVRAELAADSEARGTFLRMYDRAGRLCLELSQAHGEAALRFFDDATPRLALRQVGEHAMLTLGGDVGPARPMVELTSGMVNTRGLHLRDAGSERSVGLTLDNDRPSLEMQGDDVLGRYHSDGMWITSHHARGGSMHMALRPGRRASLSMSAQPPEAGQEAVEIVTTPGEATFWLRSVGQGAYSYLHTETDRAHLTLHPSTEGALVDLKSRDREGFATSRIHLRSGRGEESMTIGMDRSSPIIRMFNADGRAIER